MTHLPDFAGLDWYVLQVRQEARAEAKVQALGYATFLPTRFVQVQVNRKSKGKAVQKQVPALAGYLFLGADLPVKWDQVLALDEVRGVIMEFRRNDVAEWTEPLRLRAGWERGLVWEIRGEAPPPPDFEKGDAVNLIGPFADYPAKVVRLEETKDGVLATILMTIFGREVQSAVDASQLRKQRVVRR